MFELGTVSPMGQSVSFNQVMVVVVMIGKAVMVWLGGTGFKKEKHYGGKRDSLFNLFLKSL